MASLAAVALLVVVRASADDVMATPACEGGKREAEAAWKRGFEITGDRKLEKAPAYLVAAAARAALPDLQCAATLDPKPRNQAHLGQAEANLGMWTEAEAHLSRAAARSNDPWLRTWRKFVDGLLAEVRDHLGTLDLEGVPEAAAVHVEGRPLETGRSFRVLAGQVAVSVEDASWCRPFSRTLEIGPREIVKVVVAPPVCEAPPPPAPKPTTVLADAAPVRAPVAPLVVARPPPPREAPGTWKRPAAWATAGGAALFIAAGVAFHVVREVRADDFNTPGNGCGQNKPDRGIPGCDGKYDGVQTAQRLAISGYVGGGVLALSSLYLFVTRPSGSDSPPTAALACSLGVGPAMVACSARF